MISFPMGSVIDRKIGATYLLPHLSDLEQGSELENECMEIFEVDADPLPSSPPLPVAGVLILFSKYSPSPISQPAVQSFIRFGYQGHIRSDTVYPRILLCPFSSGPTSITAGHHGWDTPWNSPSELLAMLRLVGSVVFGFDQADSQLYHIATKNETPKRPFDAQDGYVAIHDTVYYVGGSYSNHDVRKTREKAFYQLLDEANCITPLLLTDTERDQMLRTANSMAEAENNKNLDVETYNFVARTWEDRPNLTKLNSPKHLPIVFPFDNKIYALAGRKPYFDLGDNFKSFEYLDISTANTHKGAATWTLLPPPPFLILRDSRHILWKEKKCLFLKVSDTPTETCQLLLWKFDLQSEKWYNYITDPDPNSSEFLTRLTDVPADHFEGCIVNDMLFQFEDDKIKPQGRLVVGYDLTAEQILGRRWEIDLKPVLGHAGQLSLSLSSFCHVADES